MDMESSRVDPVPDGWTDQKWRRMFILSLLLHVTVFSTIFLASDPMATRRVKDIVYNVDLVEMPAGTRPGSEFRVRSKKTGGLYISGKERTARRIGSVKIREKPVAIAKRTIRLKPPDDKTPAISPAELLDQVMAGISAKTGKEEKIPQTAPAPVTDKPTSPTPGPFSSGSEDESIAVRLYKLDVFEKIKSNWSYPTVDNQNPVAIVVVNVKNDGTILDFHLKKSSNSDLFDQSVLLAVKRSNPLPPFPEGYRKSHEQIEINFNLSDLKNR